MRSNFRRLASCDRLEIVVSKRNSLLFVGLAAIISLTAAAPLAQAQGSGQSTGSLSADTADGGGMPEPSGRFRHRAKFMQGEMGAEGDNADLRSRMRRAVKARQMEGANPALDAPAEGPGMGRKWRAQMMQNGGFGRRPGEMGKRGGFRGGRKSLDLTPLNLTEEQKAKIQKMRQQATPRARELKGKLLAGGQELKDMMFDPSVSDDSIRAKSRELRKLHEQAEDMKIDNFLSIRSVLTPEQRKRLPEVKPQGPRSAMADGRRGPGDALQDAAQVKQE
ncbi:MAG: Spy/CpxP family protein refolding chaperone [Candidatus Melainabacteria bacterium]|jgi:Spy/CpxP family protein refolding chaperone|nr:Spy/CpxP family protein refolding chaperone [Candidatus Melainabacteria bacterium]